MDSQTSSSFKSMGLSKRLLSYIEESGFTKPTEIQSLCIPPILDGRDIIGVAETGSGKTAAFALPTLQNLKHDKTIEVLVLVPTRELCSQVVKAFGQFSTLKDDFICQVVGGVPYDKQIRQLNGKSSVVVATPGRLLDILSTKSIKRFKPQTLIIDEADEMMEMGFLEAIKKILALMPPIEQKILFSATMPKPVSRLVNEEFSNPERIQAKGNGSDSHKDIEQVVYLVKHKEKQDALLRYLAIENPEKTILFSRTKRGVDELCSLLGGKGISVAALHGDYSQPERRRTIERFHQGKVCFLVATDVASRGLDIPDLSLVINYDFPDSKDRYTHRIGRTGRAGNKGKAISFATVLDLRDAGFRDLRKEKVPFSFGFLPDLNETRDILENKLIADVNEQYIEERWIMKCQAILLKQEPEVALAKAFALLEQRMPVDGPNHIGVSPSRLQTLLDSVASGKGDSSFHRRRGGGRRGGPRRGDSRSGGGFRGGDSRRGSFRGGDSRSGDSRSSGGGFRGGKPGKPKRGKVRPARH